MAFALSLALAGLPVAASRAAEGDASAPSATPRVQPAEKSLDELFADLKRERNEAAAERIAGRIWARWNQSGSATVDLLMLWAKEAMDKKNFPVALDMLDQVVVLEPRYAEGWNRRATLHFMMTDYSKSMVDIQHVLDLEPRHFGALSGMAQILKTRGAKQLALNAYERVLAVYPMMRQAQNEVATLSDELTGEGI